MYKPGQKVKIRSTNYGMVTAVIVREALNAYWVCYKDKEHLVSRASLDRWNKKGV